MNLSLATPEEMIFDGPAEDILLNADKGQINILPDHANLITYIKPGEMIVVGGGGRKETFEVGDGVLRVEGGKVVALCQTAKRYGE